jgi:hypothetical protein
MDRVFTNPREWLTKFEYASWEFKYIRFADGVVLFCDGCNVYDSHLVIVNSRPEVPAVFAGKILVRGKGWCSRGCSGSSTAKLPCGSSDEKYIAKALKPFGFEYDDDMRYSF